MLTRYPTNQCVGQCNATVQMAPAAINRNPASDSDETDPAAIAAPSPTTAPDEQDGVAQPDRHAEPGEGPERRRVDPPDLLRVAVDEQPVGLHARDQPPEPERLEVGVPGLDGSLDPVEVGGEVGGRTYGRFSHSACSPP